MRNRLAITAAGLCLTAFVSQGAGLAFAGTQNYPRGTTMRPNRSSDSACRTLHVRPTMSPGRNRLAGAIYGVGGPARRGRCPRTSSTFPATITVRNQSNDAIVAAQTVKRGQSFAIPLLPGRYNVESSVCDSKGPVAVTIVKRRTTLLDFVCQIK